MTENTEIVQKNIRPSDLLAANVLRLATLGVRKAVIAKELGTSLSNVNRIVYGREGQLKMQEALNNIHSDIANTLPNLMEGALGELERIMLTSQVYKTRLEAIKVAISLTLNLSAMTGGVDDERIVNQSNI
jgi:predicted transcriptional regulator